MTELNLSVYENCLDWAEDYYSRILSKQPRLGYAYQGTARMRTALMVNMTRLLLITLARSNSCPGNRVYISDAADHANLSNETEKAKLDFQAAVTFADKLHLKRQVEELLKSI